MLIAGTVGYNAGYAIYNALANTFQINAVFDTGETTGTWDTGSLTENSKFITVSNNGDQRDSTTIAATFSVANVATTSITGLGTFDPLNLGTVSAGIANSLFTIVDTATGELRYDGINPFDGTLTCSISSFKSGGTVQYNFRAFKTVGAVAFDEVEVSKSISTVLDSVTVVMSICVDPGDQFRMETEATSGTTVITVSEFSLIAV